MNLTKVFSIYICFFSSFGDTQKKVICVWRAEISADQINHCITSCTHILYAYSGITEDGKISFPFHKKAIEHIRKLVGLKLKQPSIRIMMSVGGFHKELNGAWSTVASDEFIRKKFAENVLDFLKKHNLDGIDLDWEFPNFRGDKKQDKQNFILLLKELKTSAQGYLVSASIGSSVWRMMLSYDIPKVFEVSDFVNLMSYDLHGPRETKTGIHAALYDKTNLNVDYAVSFLLKNGIPREKLIIGIPTFANGFTLINPNFTGIGVPAVGAKQKNYYEICKRIKMGTLKYHWEEDQKVPYAFMKLEWFGFDDVHSVSEKIKYVQRLSLGGALLFTLDSDDYDGRCGQGKFPLTTRAFDVLNNRNTSGNSFLLKIDPTVKPKPSVATTRPTTFQRVTSTTKKTISLVTKKIPRPKTVLKPISKPLNRPHKILTTQKPRQATIRGDFLIHIQPNGKVHIKRMKRKKKKGKRGRRKQ